MRGVNSLSLTLSSKVRGNPEKMSTTGLTACLQSCPEADPYSGRLGKMARKGNYGGAQKSFRWMDEGEVCKCRRDVITTWVADTRDYGA